VGCDSLNATNHNQIINGIFVLLQKKCDLNPRPGDEIGRCFCKFSFSSVCLFGPCLIGLLNWAIVVSIFLSGLTLWPLLDSGAPTKCFYKFCFINVCLNGNGSTCRDLQALRMY
jgi:hypothetical protein